VLFRSHQLRSSSKFIFDPMDAIVLKEVLDNINSLHTWECMLNFVDGRHPDGYTDICQYLYNNHCMTLTDDVGEASGLIVATNKGRPSKLTGILAQQFSPEDIRKQLMLREDQSLLLAVCWVSDDERRLAEMFPEVLYMDVTSQTNNEKRPLFLVAGKDSCGKSFTAARIFLP